ncbi:related to Repressible alkaline phosphatase [Saccharomycodes ludwigii]|uniref:Alkaline phosphatase n=1 Tax=Saccharomycodes ludwigii TaxID=36035 RepID=A0A376B9M8_9ASCO|nr:hypothetical protein SCDLUD_001969 [Saccharomycodes ludwigii]KAH3902156.1 hypothetical protein SCDLUD_001969 [Saccharomycodes ludwigii]SSD61321.1 related to Repressible alkaline phosphatase [Saccharomycodes ludwigii]
MFSNNKKTSNILQSPGNEVTPLINNNNPDQSQQHHHHHHKTKINIVRNKTFNKTIRYFLLSLLLLFVITELCLFPSNKDPVDGNQKHSSLIRWILFKLGLVHSGQSSRKKNLIFFVTDGMGPASISMARSWKQLTDFNNSTRDVLLSLESPLNLDQYFIGSSRTKSSSSLITDSAAGATAFSCALKSYNGAIGVDSHFNPCGTILEAAKLDGYLTGLVVTTRITDATPAAFSSHVDYRFQEDLIATQQLGEYPLGRMVDLMIGGGRLHFTEKGRKDGVNYLEKASEELGWSTVIQTRKEFDLLLHNNSNSNSTLPLLALLADSDIPFDIDRDSEIHPSLEDEAMLAIKELSHNSEKGFFLLIEGSRIDHAGHQNDPAAQVREVVAFDKMFQSVVNWAKQHTDEDTILISTSDHETGGLVTARQVTPNYPDYIWYPEILTNCKHSGEFMVKQLAKMATSIGKDVQKLENYIKETIFQNWMGITDYTVKDVQDVLDNINNLGALTDKLNGMVSVRAQIGWTTHGHSAVDVNIYAFANNEVLQKQVLNKLQGNHENIEIGKFMEDYLEVNLTSVTDLVKDTKHHPDLASTTELNESIRYDEYGHAQW